MKITLSKSQWESIGISTGWIRIARYGEQVKQLYLNQGIPSDTIDSYIEKFNIIRKRKDKELFADIPNVKIPSNKRHDISAYTDFHDLELVVDYVKGQKQITPTKDVGDSNATPIYENEDLLVYRGDNPQQCINIRGNWPLTWCVAAQGFNNLYNTYRYKEHEPTFYFVKSKKMIPTNKYHFFVIQAIKGNQYFVTSALNDGDKQMSWSEIVKIQPKLEGLQGLFVNIPLTDKERENYNKFSDSMSEEEFSKLPYEDKRMYLDVVGHEGVTPYIFKQLPDDLKAHYISFGLGLSKPHFDMIKDNKQLLKRYKQITNRKVDSYEKADDEQKGMYRFNYTEYLVADNQEEVVKKISETPILSYEFAKSLQFDLNKIPQNIIGSIAKDLGHSNDWAKNVDFNSNKIPKEIITTISSSPQWAYAFFYKAVIGLTTKSKTNDIGNIPQEIINGIARMPYYSYRVVKDLQFDLSKIPQQIIDSISTSIGESRGWMQDVGFDLTKMPQEIIDRIPEDSYSSYNFAHEVGFDLTKIPQEIINAISRVPDYSYNFAKEVGFDLSKIPQEMINSISRDSEFSYEFAKGVGFDLSKIPQKIINSLKTENPLPEFLQNTNHTENKHTANRLFSSCFNDNYIGKIS